MHQAAGCLVFLPLSPTWANVNKSRRLQITRTKSQIARFPKLYKTEVPKLWRTAACPRQLRGSQSFQTESQTESSRQNALAIWFFLSSGPKHVFFQAHAPFYDRSRVLPSARHPEPCPCLSSSCPCLPTGTPGQAALPMEPSKPQFPGVGSSSLLCQALIQNDKEQQNEAELNQGLVGKNTF